MHGKLAAIIFVSILILQSCHRTAKTELTIATAANMQYAIKEIIETFEKDRGIPCQLVLSSSGKLTAQIQENAPYDVFLSADMKYPEELYQKGRTTAHPTIYAHGRLVLWTANPELSPSLDLFKSDKITHIAIANPQTAPYGQAAIEVMHNLNFTEDVMKKLVYGESISQTNHFIYSGAADIGITSQSVVLSGDMKSKGRWAEVDTSLHRPISQGIVILTNRREFLRKSHSFQDYLLSQTGQAILEKYGYIMRQEGNDQ
jgi:molybdate transport system substrate-binding protein